jgi:hypothetical protein
MSSTRTARSKSILAALAVALLALGACAGPEAGGDEGIPYPSDLADEASPWEAEKRAIVERLSERRPQIREMLADQVLGEAEDGYLAEPPDTEAVVTAADIQVMLEDNADRAALYEVITRKSIFESLQDQVDDITFQVVSQVCPQLQDQGLPCDEEAMGERVRVALSAAVVGEELPSADSIDAIVAAVVEPIVLSTVQAVSSVTMPYIQSRFAAEYQKRAPAGTWIEVDGQWRTTN